MIFTRYLAINIFKGTGLVLIILVSLSLFFTLIQQIDHLGKGQFGLWQFVFYILLKSPSMIVDFMPLAVLIGSILSLGALASNSELIAFQASGVSVKKIIIAVSQTALVIATLTFIISDLVVPNSETSAKEIKASAIASRVSMQSRTGLWIKDGNNIIFIQQLFPDGRAKNIEIYELDEQDKLLSMVYARTAVKNESGWLLQQVKKSELLEDGIAISSSKQDIYKGNLSEQLLQSLVVNPRQMSMTGLYSYITFLQDNELNYAAESLFFWKKLYAPLTVIIMSVLAVPFILGSQRSNQSGQRIITGIMLGLIYVMLDKVLIQLGEQLKVVAFVNALIPTLLFLLFTAYLIRRKVKQGS